MNEFVRAVMYKHGINPYELTNREAILVEDIVKLEAERCILIDTLAREHPSLLGFIQRSWIMISWIIFIICMTLVIIN